MAAGKIGDLIRFFDSSEAPADRMGGNNSEISPSNANLQLESGETDNHMITDLEVDFILEELVIPKLRERVQHGNSAAFGSFLAACKHFQTHLHESRQCELRELKPCSHEEDKEEICQPTSKDIEGEIKTWSRSSISKLHDETSKFVIYQLSDITDALSKSVQIGKGGCGSVYKCELFRKMVAIKKPHPNNKSGEEEFLQEVEVLHGMHHPNLVKLLGACFQDRALVSEYLPNGSVDDHLKKQPSVLSWKIRIGIIVDTCLALKFLHSRSVVHGDLKPANILLDVKFKSKLCDFGFSRFLPEGIGMHVYLQTSPRGTLSYVDPKFYKDGILRPGSDLYSFGATILTLLTGRQSPGLKRKMHDANESSFRDMIDYTAGNWPFKVAKELRCWAMKCCYDNDKSSELMEDMSIGLEDMLEEIASTTTTEISGGIKAGITSSNSTTELDEEQYNKILVTIDDKDEARVSINEASSEDDEISFSGIGTLSDISPGIVLFSHSEILAVTDGFSELLMIGRGGYGRVYKALLYGTTVAIKVFHSTGNQGKMEFFREAEVLHKIRHPYIVTLVGACLEDRALVYEYISNGDLDDCLYRGSHLLTWQIRIRVIHRLCSALIYLHSRSMVHGDVKPGNILLDDNLNSKLTDFGLSRLLTEGTHTNAFLETAPMGTMGYIDPWFMERGILTPYSDIYSFGVVILRILTGMPPGGLIEKVKNAHADEKLLRDMLDTTAGQWPSETARELAQWGLKCCLENKSIPDILDSVLASLGDVLAQID